MRDTGDRHSVRWVAACVLLLIAYAWLLVFIVRHAGESYGRGSPWVLFGLLISGPGFIFYCFHMATGYGGVSYPYYLLLFFGGLVAVFSLAPALSNEFHLPALGIVFLIGGVWGAVVATFQIRQSLIAARSGAERPLLIWGIVNAIGAVLMFVVGLIDVVLD
jgi:hypothetical protein